MMCLQGSVCSSRATTKSNSRAVSVSMLSDASKKKAKERELVAKLQLLKSLREKDNEVSAMPMVYCFVNDGVMKAGRNHKECIFTVKEARNGA